MAEGRHPPGFKVNSGEYKLMGFAPYGEPKYTSLIRDRLVDIRDEGSITLNMQYFDYCHGLPMTGRGFERLFGRPGACAGGPRSRSARWTWRDRSRKSPKR